MKTDLISNARSTVAGALRLMGFVMLVAVLLPIQFYYALRQPNQRFRIAQICYRGIIDGPARR